MNKNLIKIHLEIITIVYKLTKAQPVASCLLINTELQVPFSIGMHYVENELLNVK